MLCRFSIWLLLTCLASACAASYPAQPTSAEPVGLLIQYAQPRGRIATTGAQNRYDFRALTVDSDGVFDVVTGRATWLSSNDGVARLNGAGAFLPTGPGAAAAVVRFAGMEATAQMLVVEPAVLNAYPRLDFTTLGTRPQAVFREGPSQSRNVTSSMSWSSSDARVATINATGQITTVGIGTTVITGTFNDVGNWYWLSFGPPNP